MRPYYERDGVTIYHGDCREVVPSIGRTVATLITDPPYGLEFMGQGWDRGVPNAETWLAFNSSLVPGSMLLSFGGTRTWHRLACAIEDAGYEIRDCLMWLYGQGFPKSHDLSKAIDRERGAVRQQTDNPKAKKQTASIGTNAYGDYEAVRTISPFPATPAAKLWNGWGTALKPAWEPIILAMKPTDGTFAQNALEHGVAGLNVDGGRIPTDENPTALRRSYGYTPNNETAAESEARGALRDRSDPEKKARPNPSDTLGRFPANLLLDETAAAMLNEQSGERPSSKGSGESRRPWFGPGSWNDGNTYDDTGGASRFFYTAKASNTDRGNVKAGPLPLFGEPEHEERNQHPTVKPTSVMAYLCKLTATPTGGLVLDPFMGSGSTLVAARQVGRPVVGVELDERWCETAAKRLERKA